MFWIRGTDGIEDGPHSPGVVRGWLLSGRLRPSDALRRDGQADWLTAADFPELHPGRGAVPPPLPPPLPAAAAPAPVTGASSSAPRSSRLALLSLVFGLLGVFLVPAVVGLVLGGVALSKIRRSGGRLTGRGMAIAGMVVSTIMLLLGIAAVVLVTVASRMHHRPPMAAPDCTGSLVQLGESLKQYANDHGDILPEPGGWCDQVQVYAPALSVFVCPANPSPDRSNFSLNRAVAGRNLDEVHPETVLLFESGGGWNSSGGADSASDPCLVFLASGEVRRLSRSELGAIRWSP